MVVAVAVTVHADAQGVTLVAGGEDVLEVAVGVGVPVTVAVAVVVAVAHTGGGMVAATGSSLTLVVSR